MNPRVTGGVDRAKGMMAGFTSGQKAIVVLAVLGLVLGAFALTRWVSQPQLVPLFGNLSGEDANAITEQLTAEGVPYELANGGTTVLVPQAQVYDLRVSMSGQGLPADESDGGYALLDEQGITATDFQQNVAYRRALEGELSKTLMAMDGVQTAVVRLAIPKRDVFSDEQDKTTSSVLLALKPGVELEREQVQSVTNLVAGSVEGLDPADVTVSDSTGKMYSSSESGGDAAASAADEQTQKYENRVGDNVERMLDRVLGADRSVVTVAADLDFDVRDSTTERPIVVPNAPPRSESETSETYEGAGAGTGGTLGTTVPDLTGGTAGGSGGTYEKTERTTNNSVGKVVERTQTAPGEVERLTVAVVLDAGAAGGVDTTQVQQLVANAVGLDPQRGDAVQVDAIPFNTAAAEAAAKELAEAQKAEQTAGYVEMAKQAGLWLLGLLVLFLLFRRGRRRGPSLEATASDLPPGGVVLTPTAISLDGGPMTALPAQDPRLSRDRVREEVAMLVDNQPDDVALMLQGWLDERKV